jgi:hypothetical protein
MEGFLELLQIYILKKIIGAGSQGKENIQPVNAQLKRKGVKDANEKICFCVWCLSARVNVSLNQY